MNKNLVKKRQFTKVSIWFIRFYWLVTGYGLFLILSGLLYASGSSLSSFN